MQNIFKHYANERICFSIGIFTEEMIVETVINLDFMDFYNICNTSRRLKDVCNNNQIMLYVIRKTFGERVLSYNTSSILTLCNMYNIMNNSYPTKVYTYGLNDNGNLATGVYDEFILYPREAL